MCVRQLGSVPRLKMTSPPLVAAPSTSSSGWKHFARSLSYILRFKETGSLLGPPTRRCFSSLSLCEIYPLARPSSPSGHRQGEERKQAARVKIIPCRKSVGRFPFLIYCMSLFVVVEPQTLASYLLGGTSGTLKSRRSRRKKIKRTPPRKSRKRGILYRQ